MSYRLPSRYVHNECMIDIQHLSSLVASSASTRRIAAELGCSQTNVRYWLKKHGFIAKKSDGKNDRPCLHCGSPIGKNATKFCSNKCRGEFSTKHSVERWLAGEISGALESGTLRSFIRDYLIKERGACCEQCGWSEVNPATGCVPIAVDHKDGRWQNSMIENLRLLCPNCHSLTPTYGKLNEGNGRPWKKKLRA